MTKLEFNYIQTHLTTKGSKVSNGQNSTLHRAHQGLVATDPGPLVIRVLVWTDSDFLISFPSNDMMTMRWNKNKNNYDYD